MSARVDFAGGRSRRAEKLAARAQNARGAARRPLEHINQAVQRGQSLVDALPGTGRYFPPLFHEMVAVGEQTGHLDLVLKRLAEHYQHQLNMKKEFRRAISGPVLQLTFALFVVGLIIWIMGLIAGMAGHGGKPLDLLGLGLFGTDGVIKYVTFLACVAAVGWFAWRQIKRGALWGEWIQEAAMRIPKVGRGLEVLALSRFCWSLQLTLNTEMSLRKALSLAFASTLNAHFSRHAGDVLQRIRDGNELTETLSSTGVFPGDFIDAVNVGEQTGQLFETMGVLSEHYQEEGRDAIRALAKVASGTVWLLVVGLIVMIIFRIAMVYVGIINDAANGKF